MKVIKQGASWSIRKLSYFLVSSIKDFIMMVPSINEHCVEALRATQYSICDVISFICTL